MGRGKPPGSRATATRRPALPHSRLAPHGLLVPTSPVRRRSQKLASGGGPDGRPVGLPLVPFTQPTRGALCRRCGLAAETARAKRRPGAPGSDAVGPPIALAAQPRMTASALPSPGSAGRRPTGRAGAIPGGIAGTLPTADMGSGAVAALLLVIDTVIEHEEVDRALLMASSRSEHQDDALLHHVLGLDPRPNPHALHDGRGRAAGRSGSAACGARIARRWRADERPRVRWLAQHAPAPVRRGRTAVAGRGPSRRRLHQPRATGEWPAPGAGVVARPAR